MIRISLLAIACWTLAVTPAVRAAPTDSAAARIEAAKAALGTGRTDDAIANFRAALAIEPGNAVAHNALGSLLNSAGRYAEALPHALAAVAADPRNGRYRYNAGVVLAEHGRFDEARAAFDVAIAAHPDLTYAYLERGAVRLSLGDAAGARADWAKAAEVEPKLIWTQWYPATGHFVAGDYRQAAEGFERVAAAEPAFVPAQLWRTVALARAGTPIATPSVAGGDWPAPILNHYRGALSAESLLALAADDRASGDQRRIGEAHFFIGQRALTNGRRAEAAAHFRKALAVKAPRHVWKIAAERELQQLKPKGRSR